MQTYVGLLRGINVGRNKKLPMADLRSLCESIGFENPRTYIQSGNLVFESEQNADAVRVLLADAIEQEFGFSTDVMIVTAGEFGKAAAAYPFETSNHKLAHIMFLNKNPRKSDISEVLAIDFSPDLILIDGRTIHFYLPNGVLESNIDFKKVERMLKISGTARNWRTVQKIVGMSS